MKKFRLIILLMFVTSIALVACDAAIPEVGPDASESEEMATEASPETAEMPEEPTAEESGEAPVEPPPEEESVEAGGRIVTTWVGPELVDCVGVGPQKCLQVKTNPEDEYSLFYDQIEGFDYQEGYEYELQVLVEPVPNPPADGSALKFTLIEIVSQIPVTAEQPAIGQLPVDEALTLEGPTWLLDTYLNLDGEPTERLPETRVTINFATGEVNGNAGCNNYFGPYAVDGNNLTIGPVASTLMACIENDVAIQETAYLAILGDVASYEILDNQLHLQDADGQTILIFNVEDKISLTGTVWTVTGYNNGRGGVTSVILDTEMTALFSENGLVAGSAGCNNYRAAYEADDNSINIGPAAITRKMCAAPEGIMEQEGLYLAALEMAATYEIDGSRMDMYDADGARVATFTASTTVEEMLDESIETVDIPVVAADATAEEGSEKTIYVGPEMVDCVGEGPQQCLLVKEDPDTDYQFWYFSIEGFDYEPGYEYELIVREEMVENPPAGGSSIKWVLVEEVSKTPVETIEGEAESTESAESAAAAAVPEAVELTGTSWQWIEMVTPIEIVTVDDPGNYLVEFLPEGIINIQADCNSGSGTYEASGGALSINITSTTLALCPEESLSDLFIRSLNAAAIYFDQGGNLFVDLFADAGTMEFAPN